MKSRSAGTLHIVATPIGNLDDISPRARRVLGSVDLIAAEDTRRTRRLLTHIGVGTPLIACHEHNEIRQTPRLIERLREGASIALVSDAGTPLLSDPGLLLVRAAHAAAVPVVAVPGPSALAAALSVAGLPTDRFVFEGFLPRRPGPRRARLERLAREPGTVVLFESVHRIGGTVAEARAQFGADRPASLVRELTKMHESVHSGTLASLDGQLGAEVPLKGEFVLVIAGVGKASRLGRADRVEQAGKAGQAEQAGQAVNAEQAGSTERASKAEQADWAEQAEILRVHAVLAAEVSGRTAVSLTAKIVGAPRNRVYALTRGRPL